MKIERSDSSDTLPTVSEGAKNSTPLRTTKYPRSFVCQYCSKGYTRECNLKEHLARSHGENYKISARSRRRDLLKMNRDQKKVLRKTNSFDTDQTSVPMAPTPPSVFRKYDSPSYIELASVGSASVTENYEDNSSSVCSYPYSVCKEEVEEQVCNALLQSEEDDEACVATTVLSFEQF